MEGMGQLQFSDLLTELLVPPQAVGVVGTFKCDFYYIPFLALGSHFWTLRMQYYFYNVSFFIVYVHTEVPLSMSLFGFRMGTMLANFHICSIMLLIRAV